MSAISLSLPSGFAHAVWRANQVGMYQSAATSSGFPVLDAVLPQGGWPGAALIELLLQQPGIGELRLLQPALEAIARKRSVVMVQPPCLPQAAAWQGWGLAPQQLLWIRTRQTADALWSAEQVLKNGSCGVLLLWQQQVRPEALRRLHLAAQAADTLFWMMRPLAAAQDSSPSPLRLALRPAPGGLALQVIKRRGPQLDETLFIALPQAAAYPNQNWNHATVDRRAPAPVAAGSVPAAMV
ncbi:translesion DNA synthesis-associated protein ImuA [Lacisediminimonas profundi]|uniref:translesion DNA synthesis-associated protein ImuA n=1 Tax=Lacisediminimonas profundi TaxID=2603856 RepID=UPI00124B97EC|nr:translesion DNA synthesis-associated protein ImuA [Lacisediminimonas profundi]